MAAMNNKTRTSISIVNWRNLKLKWKLGVGFTVMLACLLGLALQNWNSASAVKDKVVLAREESAVFALKGKDLQFHAVQVQQWLTDISATQGRKGFDDGFDEAEANAADFKRLLNDFREMYTREQDDATLAKQTADATEDIRGRIEGIQGSTGKAVESIGQISDVIQQVNVVSKTIASAVEEQSITTKEIARNVTQTSDAASLVSTGVSESASASQEITRTIAGVDQAARQTAQGASQTQTASGELSKVAEELQSLVGQFKV